MQDMPKLEAPFLRVGNERFVVDQVNPGYEWVFQDPNVLCVEKIDGTNVSIYMHEGKLVHLFNRLNTKSVDVLATDPFIDGVRLCFSKGRLPMETGQHFGELMGPQIQHNFLKLERSEWFPFSYLRSHFAYKSFHKYEKTFQNLSNWFKNDLFSLMYAKFHGDKVSPEGVVFYQPSTGNMAKLRRDMFDWYVGKRHGKKELEKCETN